MLATRPFAVGAAILVLAACYNSATDPSEMQLTTPPDLIGVVQQITHDTSFAPAGFQLDQYEIFIAIPPATAANAGVILGPHTTAFRSHQGLTRAVDRAAIAVGDTLRIWVDGAPAFGSVQAPPGAPAYIAAQVVLQH